MIPTIKEIAVEKKKWLTEDEMLEMLAIAESTPGPIAINMATYIGFKQKKLLGAIFATLGVILPSFIIILIISLFIDRFMNNIYVQYAFVGINCGVAFLIIKAAIGLFKKMKKNVFNIIVFSIVFIIMILLDLFALKLSSIYLILAGGILGIITYTIIDAKEKNKENVITNNKNNEEVKE